MNIIFDTFTALKDGWRQEDLLAVDTEVMEKLAETHSEAEIITAMKALYQRTIAFCKAEIDNTLQGQGGMFAVTMQMKDVAVGDKSYSFGVGFKLQYLTDDRKLIFYEVAVVPVELLDELTAIYKDIQDGKTSGDEIPE